MNISELEAQKLQLQEEIAQIHQIYILKGTGYCAQSGTSIPVELERYVRGIDSRREQVTVIQAQIDALKIAEIDALCP
jgi:hypothetical protein